MGGILWKIITDNWGIILMAPAAFLAAVFLGSLIGWMVVRLVYNQRLAHQQDMITKLRAILEEKLPASFLPPPKRNRTIFGGLGLAVIGLTMVALGTLWKWEPKPGEQKASITEVLPINPLV
jgi:hypothetical protein